MIRNRRPHGRGSAAHSLLSRARQQADRRASSLTVAAQ